MNWGSLGETDGKYRKYLQNPNSKKNKISFPGLEWKLLLRG